MWTDTAVLIAVNSGAPSDEPSGLHSTCPTSGYQTATITHKLEMADVVKKGKGYYNILTGNSFIGDGWLFPAESVQNFVLGGLFSTAYIIRY